MIQRTATAVVGIPLFLGLLFWGGFWSQLLVVVLIGVGLSEFGRMVSGPIYWDFLFLTGLSVPLMVFFVPFGHSGWLLWFVATALYFFIRTSLTARPSVCASSFHLSAVVYVAGLYSFIWLLRDQYGFVWIMFALVVTWATDVGAFLVGRKYGRHKLAPIISPNKSVEGSIGGFTAAMLGAALFSMIPFVPVALVPAVVLSALLSIIGQVGDLVESGLKRECKTKDSGRLLPGHGGILDRFDSLAFIAPFLYVILSYL